MYNLVKIVQYNSIFQKNKNSSIFYFHISYIVHYFQFHIIVYHVNFLQFIVDRKSICFTINLMFQNIFVKEMVKKYEE